MGKEKKEIWKLLELLNEYHHFNSDLIGYFYDDEYDKFYFRTELPEEKKEELKNADALMDDGISEVRVEDERIISKKFWFIFWLVKNDKIEFREDFYLEDQHWWWFGEDEDIIMLLAIQDEPIRFLCEILK